MIIQEIIKEIQSYQLSSMMMYASFAKISKFMALNDFKRFYRFLRNKELCLSDKTEDFICEYKDLLALEPSIKPFFDIESKYLSMKTLQIENIMRQDFIKDSINKTVERHKEFKKLLSMHLKNVRTDSDECTVQYLEKLFKKTQKMYKKTKRMREHFEKLCYKIDLISIDEKIMHDKYALKSKKIGFKEN